MISRAGWPQAIAHCISCLCNDLSRSSAVNLRSDLTEPELEAQVGSSLFVTGPGTLNSTSRHALEICPENMDRECPR